MEILPIRDLKNTLEIEKKCCESNNPIFITKNGYGKLVVMSIECFEKLLSEAYEANGINQGLDDIENGKVVKGEKALAQIKQKYGFH